eukprot:103868-Amphidinium_carterae.1
MCWAKPVTRPSSVLGGCFELCTAFTISAGWRARLCYSVERVDQSKRCFRAYFAQAASPSATARRGCTIKNLTDSKETKCGQSHRAFAHETASAALLATLESYDRLISVRA